MSLRLLEWEDVNAELEGKRIFFPQDGNCICSFDTVSYVTEIPAQEKRIIHLSGCTLAVTREILQNLEEVCNGKTPYVDFPKGERRMRKG